MTVLQPGTVPSWCRPLFLCAWSTERGCLGSRIFVSEGRIGDNDAIARQDSAKMEFLAVLKVTPGS